MSSLPPGPQAYDDQRRVRGARHSCRRRRRARVSGSTVRCRRPPNCSRLRAVARVLRRRRSTRDQPRHPERAGRARACRSSPTCPQGTRNTRSTWTSPISPPSEWCWARRSRPPRCADRQQSGLFDPRRREDRRHCRRRSIIASRAAMPMPKCACTRRSMKPHAPGSASISAACQRPGADQDRRPRAGSEGESRYSVEADLSRQDRQAAAGLVEAGRQAGARDFHADQQAAIDALRRLQRSRRRARWSKARSRSTPTAIS